MPLAESAARLGVEWDATARAAARRLPLRFPRGYADLANPADPTDPIRAIAWPAPEELQADPAGIADPVGEARLKQHPLLVRKYRDRALLIVTNRCHFYCRFCFRAGQPKDATLDDLRDAVALLRDDRDVREVILSGGDPLVLPDRALADVLRLLADVPALRTVRIHTRAPVSDPPRVTRRLARTLVDASPAPLWMVVHTSHPRELTAGFDRAIGELRRAGIALLNQTVLLHGVNDDPATLAELFGALGARGVKPYYLHHPDRVPGTARFRVTIPRGLAIVRALRKLVPGPAMPAYVVDLPDGSGKVPVDWLAGIAPGRYEIRHADGRVSRYDDIEEPDDDRV